MVGCHTSKQWVEQNSIHKDGNYGLKNCTQHKKVRIMIDLFTLKPLHLWPVSPGGWLRNRKHASSILFSFETRRRRTKLLCRVKEIRWLWTVSHSLHMTSRGHLKKDLVQTNKLYLSQFQLCPPTAPKPPPHPLPRAFVRHLSPGGRALENLCPGVEHFSVLLEAF